MQLRQSKKLLSTNKADKRTNKMNEKGGYGWTGALEDICSALVHWKCVLCTAPSFILFCVRACVHVCLREKHALLRSVSGTTLHNSSEVRNEISVACTWERERQREERRERGTNKFLGAVNDSEGYWRFQAMNRTLYAFRGTTSSRCTFFFTCQQVL